MRNTVSILGINIDKVSMKEAVLLVERLLNSGSHYSIYTPNAEIMMAAKKDETLRKLLNDADLLVADGAGVVIASKILGLNLPERVAGFDLINNIFKLDIGRKIKIFLLGGEPGIAEEASKNITRTFFKVEIVGVHHGYFDIHEEELIIKDINSTNPDILLVALGAPKQEFWIDKYKKVLNTKISIGVGGSLDIISGKSKRAPEFFQKNSLEWLYRLIKEPRRFWRMMALPKFILIVICKRIFKTC